MQRTILLHDRTAILARLADHRALNVYAVGDLDDAFFPYTSWFALEENGQLRQLVLMYMGASPPVIHAIAADREGDMRTLLKSMMGVLPRCFYMHITPSLLDVFTDEYTVTSRGLHRKMVLVDRDKLDQVDVSHAEPLTVANKREVTAFYEQAYPGNWFDPKMLETERYVGARVDGRLVAAAGVHVFSHHYRVAALGNIAVLPTYRGRGIGSVVTAAACLHLLPDCNTIGLNVHNDNTAAIRVYERLGFETVGMYEEAVATAR
ncbi:MAG: GNAT family N-acetyltransferase [Polyangiaceae bacterium]|nr:GNAT family N-acetyltransferase [Polyangiaceae bacterium]